MFKMVKAESSTVSESAPSETEDVPAEEKQHGKLTEYDDEYDLLESRLEEQTQLIMILKKSLRDSDAKYKRLEKENRKLTSIRDIEDTKLKQQAEELTKLNDRLKTMKSNYKDLSALVKDYKNQNDQLLRMKVSTMEENDHLFQSAKQEADKQIQAVTNEHMELKNQCAFQEKTISEEKQQIEIKKSEYRMSIAKEKQSHKSTMKSLMDDLQEKKTKLEDKKEALEREEGLLIREMPTPDELIKLEVKNKSLRRNSAGTQETLMLEKRKTLNLQHLIQDLDDKVKLLITTFEQKAAEVQANEEVNGLQDQIKEAQLQFEKTKEEITQFKKEAQEKLHEERELNKKLRHIN